MSGSDSDTEKSRASDLDGAGPSIPPPLTHVPEREAVELMEVLLNNGALQGHPMPQGVMTLSPPELAVTGNTLSRGQSGITGAQRRAATHPVKN